MSTGFGLANVEKCFENAFWNVGSAFPNLLLGSIKLLQKIIASQKSNTSHRIIGWFIASDVFFVTTLQGWVYKTQQTREMHWWSSDVFFVTILQGWVYKTQQTRKMYATCIMIVCCFLCNNIARMGLQNTTNTRDAWWSSDVFFVTILQGWAYKTQQTCEMLTIDQTFMSSLFTRHAAACVHLSRQGAQRVAQILYSHPWKVLPASGDTTDLLFCLPKSSFGEHKINTTWISGRFHNPLRTFRSCMLHLYKVRKMICRLCPSDDLKIVECVLFGWSITNTARSCLWAHSAREWWRSRRW